MSDVIDFVFTRIFNIKIDSESNDKVTFADNFDLLKFSIAEREIFYKYYPRFADNHRDATKIYSLKDMERDLLRDNEMIYIPDALIDPDVILTKKFDKLLSQDYNIINAQQNFNQSPEQYFLCKFKYIVKYGLNVFGNNNNGGNNSIIELIAHVDPSDSSKSFFFNVDYYCALFGSNKVLNKVSGAADVVKTDALIEYLNNCGKPYSYNNININVIKKIEPRVLLYDTVNKSDTCGKSKCTTLCVRIKDEIWSKLNDEGKLYISASITKEYEKLPTNLHDEINLHIPLQFFKDIEYKCKFNNMDQNFLIRCINNDTYKGEWHKLNPKCFKHYDLIELSDTCRLNEDGIKEEFKFDKNKTIINEICYMIDRSRNTESPYTSVELFKLLVNYDVKLSTAFDKTIPEIKEAILSIVPPDYLYNIFKCELEITDYPKIENLIFDECEQRVDNDNKHLVFYPHGVLDIFNLYHMNTTNTFIEYYNRQVNEELFPNFKRFKREFKNYMLWYFKSINETYESGEPYTFEFSDAFIDFFTTQYDNDTYGLRNVFDTIIRHAKCDKIELLNRICEKCGWFVYDYLHSIMNNVKGNEYGQFNENIFNELINKYIPENERNPNENKELAKLGQEIIKSQNIEPFLCVYASPITVVNGDTNADVWKNYVNKYTIPIEMTNMSFYNFMIKCNGKKKNERFTSCYTFFSNSLENKIVFCEARYTLDSPAVLRFDVPIEFETIKPFLHENIDTNDICMFTTLNKDDWSKISGGNTLIDCVVFSDSKNIYRQRTPLRTVLEHLINSIEIEFETKVLTNDEQ